MTIAMSDGGNAKYPFMGCTVLQFWVESYRLLVGQSLARPDRGTVHTVAVGPSGHPPLVPPMQKPGPYCHFGELAAGRGQEPVGVVGTSWGRCRGRQSVSQSVGWWMPYRFAQGRWNIPGLLLVGVIGFFVPQVFLQGSPSVSPTLVLDIGNVDAVKCLGGGGGHRARNKGAVMFFLPGGIILWLLRRRRVRALGSSRWTVRVSGTPGGL